MLKNLEQPINPMPHQNQDGTIQYDVYFGLTKREHFAISAMKGFLANSSETEISSTYVLEAIGLPKETKYSFDEHYTKYVSQIAVKYADALLAELSIGNGQ
jgi:hypothetical protein